MRPGPLTVALAEGEAWWFRGFLISRARAALLACCALLWRDATEATHAVFVEFQSQGLAVRGILVRESG